MLTPQIMQEYLGCGSRSALQRRLARLREAGCAIPEKDEDLGGWLREEVDLVLKTKRGLIERDDRDALVGAARGGGA